jgi:hypothetical protein
MSDILQESLIMSFLFYIGPSPTHNSRGIIITILVLEIVIHLLLCVDMGRAVSEMMKTSKQKKE